MDTITHSTFAERKQLMSEITTGWSREELVVSLTHKADTIDALLVEGQSLTARLTVLAGALDAIAALAPRLTNDPWAVLKEIESTARAARGAER